MARRKKQEERAAGAPAWMCTFADLMSLLLTFFVLLLSFSTIAEPIKYQQAMVSLRNAFGATPMMEQNSPVAVNAAPPKPPRAKSLQRIARELRRRLQVLGRDSEVDMKYEDQGLRINLPSQLLFDSGSAQMREDALEVVQSVGELLGEATGARIEVRGHTDNIPLREQQFYRDNYDLSYGRAKSVTRYLLEFGGMPMEQFEIVALGPNEPMASNETEDGRAANRRVEIVVRAPDDETGLEQLEETMERRDMRGGASEPPAAAP